VLNSALMTAGCGYTFAEARADTEFWGRLVESAVGAHLANAAQRGECALHYWRERNMEVDFIVRAGRKLIAIEVKSGRTPVAHAGTSAFMNAFHPHRSLLVGADGLDMATFLTQSVAALVG
jgi:hypothetical protein